MRYNTKYRISHSQLKKTFDPVVDVSVRNDWLHEAIIRGQQPAHSKGTSERMRKARLHEASIIGS